MKIELLFFDGCPSHEHVLPQIEQLAREAGARMELRRVDSLEAAEHERCLYRTATGASATPPDEWLRAALQRATSS